MPATREGLQKLLEFFLVGMLKAADTLGNTEVFLRTVEEEGLRQFMTFNMPNFRPEGTATETCRAYTAEVDKDGLFDGSDTVFRGDDQTIHVEIGDRCVYRRVCTLRHDEGLPVHCIRGYALGEMLRIRADADFKSKLEAFGRPCRITMTRSHWR